MTNMRQLISSTVHFNILRLIFYVSFFFLNHLVQQCNEQSYNYVFKFVSRKQGSSVINMDTRTTPSINMIPSKTNKACRSTSVLIGIIKGNIDNQFAVERLACTQFGMVYKSLSHLRHHQRHKNNPEIFIWRYVGNLTHESNSTIYKQEQNIQTKALQ